MDDYTERMRASNRWRPNILNSAPGYPGDFPDPVTNLRIPPAE